mgnify:CR=1 FL=1
MTTAGQGAWASKVTMMKAAARGGWGGKRPVPLACPDEGSADVQAFCAKNTPEGTTGDVPAFQGTFNMPAIHFFKIRKGKIYDIEATGLVLPYGTKTGWE